MNIAKFIKNDGTFVGGAFEIDDRNKVRIRIESENNKELDEFKHADFINCISNSKKYFFFQTSYINKGYITSRGITTFFLELYAYAFGENEHCKNIDDFKIETVLVHFNYFDDWYLGLRANAIDEETHLKALSENYLGATKENIFTIDDNIQIAFVVNGTTLYNFKEQYTVYFSAKSKKFTDYWSAIIKFSRFLSIMCFRPVEILGTITCMLPETKIIDLNFYNWIEEEKLDKQFNLSYNEIGESFPTIIKNFYNNEKIESAISTLNSSLYIKESAIGGTINKFLNLTRTIESLYENVLFDFSEQEQQYREKITNIINKLEEKQDRQFMYEKLNLAHKATFVMKLSQFFKHCKNILNIDDEKCLLLAKIMRKTRNYYTHLLNSKKLVIKETYLSLFNRALFALINFKLIHYLNENNAINARFAYLNMTTQPLKKILETNINDMLEE